MFTGIITDIGTVREIEADGDPRYVIGTRYDTATIALGASVACSGACLTVIETGPDWFKMQVSAETLSLTTVARWRIGTRINLERALRLGDELGGHIVSGHVDGVGRIVSRHPEQQSERYVIEVPKALAPLIARKGSVAIEGISLTVNEVDGARFGVNIIPHTQRETTLGDLVAGDAVNIEVDMLARYVARLLEKEQG
jgi:riboflavin synthase